MLSYPTCALNWYEMEEDTFVFLRIGFGETNILNYFSLACPLSFPTYLTCMNFNLLSICIVMWWCVLYKYINNNSARVQ